VTPRPTFPKSFSFFFGSFRFFFRESLKSFFFFLSCTVFQRSKCKVFISPGIPLCTPAFPISFKGALSFLFRFGSTKFKGGAQRLPSPPPTPTPTPTLRVCFTSFSPQVSKIFSLHHSMARKVHLPNHCRSYFF